MGKSHTETAQGLKPRKSVQANSQEWIGHEMIRDQVADLLVLQNYVIEILDLQQCEMRLREDPVSVKMVARCLAALRDHKAELVATFASFPASNKDLRKPSASMAEMFVGLITKNRSRELPAILRDDFSFLSRVVMSYTILHTTALGLRDLNTARLTLEHLKQLLPLMQQINILVPLLVERHLKGAHPKMDGTSADEAAANISAIWRKCRGRPRNGANARVRKSAA